LNQVIADRRSNGPKLALLFIDLDDSKHVNDSMGHGVGDELLRRVARRLIANTRAADGIVRWQPRRPGRQADPAAQLVTRIGGDEFVVVQEGIRSVDDALVLGRRVAGLLVKPFILAGRATHISASIGISVAPDHGDDVDSLLKNADAAMYQAKAKGRGGVELFDESINRRTVDRVHVENDLRKAVEAKEFFVQYQPRVDLAAGRVVGVEALVRWRHPTKGVVLPKDFILIAEEIGVIGPLGQLVLEQACNQARIWRQQGHSFFVSINLSAHQLDKAGLVQSIADCVEKAGLPPDALELEITESAMMKDVEASAAVAAKLRDLGFSLSIDDFGTGYSSLHRLKKLPVNALKLDCSFVSDMTVDDDSDSIVRTLIELGRSLGLRTVAEGVETAEQISRLQSYGCDEAQGYFLSRALNPDKLREWLAAWKGIPIDAGVPAGP
jgi:predicted signal transduction protein with EAL and GGDEF domain